MCLKKGTTNLLSPSQSFNRGWGNIYISSPIKKTKGYLHFLAAAGRGGGNYK
jgi:hypothetical protein